MQQLKVEVNTTYYISYIMYVLALCIIQTYKRLQCLVHELLETFNRRFRTLK